MSRDLFSLVPDFREAIGRVLSACYEQGIEMRPLDYCQGLPRVSPEWCWRDSASGSAAAATIAHISALSALSSPPCRTINGETSSDEKQVSLNPKNDQVRKVVFKP